MAISEPIIVSKSLPTIHLDLLRAESADESGNLLDACKSHGFFYLDLTSDAELCRLWAEMLRIMAEYFNQPLEVKMQDARGSDNFGYEPMGTEEGPNPKTRDGYESLKFSRREFLKGSSDLTTSVRAQEDSFFSFIKNAHEITLMILSRLSSQLGRTDSARFEAHHADPGPSLSTLGLLRYPKHDRPAGEPRNVGHNKHTDVGSLTFLLAAQWGLQYLSLTSRRWEFIEPRPGHAIINVGDSLRFLSGGELASVVHRVVPLRKTQDEDRYSIAYFLRMNDGGVFSDTTGKAWTANEWHDFKFGVFKNPSVLDVKGQFLTGMMIKDSDKLEGHAAVSA
ncbi:Putative oxoglutarate/iron-dependent dioxygenase, non-hem dioxygenase domain-containing protein [Colletotrichum destructivum]|uniref:Oxoglutarate/iron-dependent dioxygenase, non-hem dioxygenase domain-containing protein n=1 Tax=Colletotrichum destructivum TaxID=34406 RepID=A0AAX4ID21_9PEZI|nr:Putative oxoglutarate/iron-dependent dioxygenase, non-hem dioxygenase domain-containing protein [Colletotrichum destructivum]